MCQPCSTVKYTHKIWSCMELYDLDGHGFVRHSPLPMSQQSAKVLIGISPVVLGVVIPKPQLRSPVDPNPAEKIWKSWGASSWYVWGWGANMFLVFCGWKMKKHGTTASRKAATQGPVETIQLTVQVVLHSCCQRLMVVGQRAPIYIERTWGNRQNPVAPVVNIRIALNS